MLYILDQQLYHILYLIFHLLISQFDWKTTNTCIFQNISKKNFLDISYIIWRQFQKGKWISIISEETNLNFCFHMIDHKFSLYNYLAATVVIFLHPFNVLVCDISYLFVRHNSKKVAFIISFSWKKYQNQSSLKN